MASRDTSALARRAWWREFVQLYAVAIAVTALPAVGAELLRRGYLDRLFGNAVAMEVVDSLGTESMLSPEAGVSAPPPEVELQERLQRAFDALLHADFETAIAAADEAAAVDPTSERAAGIKASALLERHFATTSPSDLVAARAMAASLSTSGEPAALTALGNLALAGGDVPRAIQLFQSAARIDLGDAYARHQLGFALQSVGRLDEAIASFQQALALAPDMAWARQNIAICLNAIGAELFAAKRYVGAADRFHQAIEADPNNGLARANLAMTLLVGGKDRPAAEAQAALAKQLGTTDHPVFAALGW